MDEDLIVGMGLDAEDTPEVETPSSESEETIGNIKISVDVVGKIAALAAAEIEGVACMHISFVDGVAQRLGAKKNSAQGVKVEITDSVAVIDLYLVVDYGVRIPELAWNVQERVKEKVEAMTGLSVESVNIHIESINFETDKAEVIEDAQ